ncbi:MAG TPA: diaminopimelate decarboxylase [Gammaproteobacteria bacterium]|nr:diaminopimelate decarboxylase [Gammaproteobacteria bacterium]
MAPVSAFQYRDGVLHAEDVPLPQLAAACGTPLYVYARRALTDSWRQFAQPLVNTPHQVCYAVKANGTLALLQVLAQLGAGFDIVSGGELARVLRAGGDPGRVVFSGVGKRSDELEQALAAGAGCFNVESAAELDRLNALALARKLRAPVALRINPDVDANTHPHIATGHSGAKFGIELAQAEAVAMKAAQLPGIQLEGLACHVGSQITDIGPFREAARRLTDLADRLRARGIALQHLNFGGGFPVRYKPDESLPDVATLLNELRGFAETRGLSMRIEPGRALVAPAGLLLTRVEYLKRTAHRRFAIVDAGMTELIRPALYDAWHEIREVAPGAGATELYDVAGPVCESADVLGRERRLAARPGDLLAVMDAGAYGASMASNYNARPRAAEVLVDGAHTTVIRRRETLDDLMALENLL